MSSKRTIIEFLKVSKSFTQGDVVLEILQEISFKIKEGDVVALVGPSGSGKSTLLQLAGLLDNANKGDIIIDEIACNNISDRKKTRIRKEKLGFVYQAHHLLPEFSALENVMLPKMIAGKSKNRARQDAVEVLSFLGLKERLNHKPGQLSGGEQQRVAIARAIVNRPALLLADEPTGNLDPKTAADTFAMLMKTIKNTGISALIVTHNLELAKKMDRVLTIKKGKVVEIRRV